MDNEERTYVIVRAKSGALFCGRLHTDIPSTVTGGVTLTRGRQIYARPDAPSVMELATSGATVRESRAIATSHTVTAIAIHEPEITIECDPSAAHALHDHADMEVVK